MPSVTHEAPIELIRQHPDLAVELLRAMSDVDLPSEIAVSLGPTDLSEVVPQASPLPARAPTGDLPGSR